MAKRHRYFPKENIQTANKHIKGNQNHDDIPFHTAPLKITDPSEN